MRKHVLIIAEAGVNHNGSIEMAKQLIDVATEAGADIVKFQSFKASHLVSKDAKTAAYQKKNLNDTDDSQFNMLKKLELDEAAHIELIAYCNAKKIEFLSTGFDAESVELLSKLGIRLNKVPSGEITNKPFLRQLAHQQKPLIISTGMANLSEIEEAINVIISEGLGRENITILHCNTEYPTPMEDVNLRAMQTIKEAFKVKVGYSDHTKGIEVAIAAVAMGAEVIEKHFTLDKSLPGPDHKASLEPQELKNMVAAIRNIEFAIGGNGLKETTPSEMPNKLIARKSIHLAREVMLGEVLTNGHLIMKRPGDGISPMMIDMVLGRKVKDTLPADYKLDWKDLG
jgi:N,N'-diacetyllegionaminate synthase